MTDLKGKEVEVNPLLAGYEGGMFRELIFACLSPKLVCGRVCDRAFSEEVPLPLNLL
jgi:hypothetical protein